MKDYKPALLVASILLFSIFGSVVLVRQRTMYQPRAVTPSTVFYAYNTHPNYWPAGSNLWTAKKYTLVNGTFNPGYNNYWVWSGRMYVPDTGHRFVVYEKYNNDTSLGYREWEMWLGAISSYAQVFKYGGPSEAQAKTIFPSKSACQSRTSAGVIWPTLTPTNDLAYIAQSVRYPSGYCTDPYPNGDYIAVKMLENWSSANSDYRKAKCDYWIPSSQAQVTNSICKNSKYVGIIQQRYVVSKDASAPGPKYDHGCEVAIYAYGYPYSAENNYRNWFRNGELRFSDYMSAAKLDYVVAPDNDAWWNYACAGDPNHSAWYSVPNWFYTGLYKSDSSTTVYTDPGGY